MFKRLFGLNQADKKAHKLYGAVVARARDIHIYKRYGVPDTFDGRFEMLVMHLFLLFSRLKNEDAASREISQKVFDCFINDMEAALREAGVGDPTIPKRIAKMMRVFYGRTGAFEKALVSKEPQLSLESVIARNLFPEDDSMGKETALAEYMKLQIMHLQQLTAIELTANKLVFSEFNSTNQSVSVEQR